MLYLTLLTEIKGQIQPPNTAPLHPLSSAPSSFLTFANSTKTPQKTLSNYSLSLPTEISTINMNGSSVILSETFVVILGEDQIIIGKYAFGNISHCIFQPEASNTSVILVVYQANSNDNVKNSPFNLSSKNPFNSGDSPYRRTRRVNQEDQHQQNISIQCKSRLLAVKLYNSLVVCSVKMGNFTSQSQVLSLSLTPTSPMRENASFCSYDGYQFGTANNTKYTIAQYTEVELLNRTMLRLSLPFIPENINHLSNNNDQEISMAFAFATALDKSVWRTIFEWTANHQQLQSSKCIAALLINQSDTPVQILKADIQEGRNIHIFSIFNSLGGDMPSKGYDKESR